MAPHNHKFTPPHAFNTPNSSYKPIYEFTNISSYVCDIDVIQGVQPTTLEDLGVPRQRDPDALPPRNAFEWIMSVLYYAAAGLAQGNALFAIKAGLFTVVLCLPYFIQNSADFAYRECILAVPICGFVKIDSC